MIKLIVKDFLLQNIKKWNLQKKRRRIRRGKAKQKYDKNESKEGQTYKAGYKAGAL